MNIRPKRIRRNRTLVRAGMILVAVPQAVTGAWAWLAPRSWYETFPGFGRVWVAPIGPYNQHFISEVGNLLVIMSLLVLFAAVTLNRLLVRVSLVAWLLFAIPHFIAHVRLTRLLDTVDNVGSLAVLGVAIVIPVLLLVSTWRRPHF